MSYLMQVVVTAVLLGTANYFLDLNFASLAVGIVITLIIDSLNNLKRR